MSISDKLSVARQLARLGVDVIEAGFPAASPGDREAVHAIATEVGTSDGPTICGLARAVVADILRCEAAIRPATLRRIHTFIATSDIHLAHKLRMSRDQVIARVTEAVSCARSLCNDVEFSAEDATRSDAKFLCDVLSAAIAAGATTINVPDTVGYTTPLEYEHLMRRICELAPGAPEVVISTHCHDDLGLATANSLAEFTPARVKWSAPSRTEAGRFALINSVRGWMQAELTKTIHVRSDVPLPAIKDSDVAHPR